MKIKSILSRKSQADQLIKALENLGGRSEVYVPHPSLIIAERTFANPNPPIASVSLLSLAFMQLLIRYVYPKIDGRAKFTLVYHIDTDGDTAAVTLSCALKLTYEDNSLIPTELVFQEIVNIVQKYSEKYGGTEVVQVVVRGYCERQKAEDIQKIPSASDCDRLLKEVYKKYESIQNLHEDRWGYYKDNEDNNPTFIKQIKQSSKDNRRRKPFMVADLETIPHIIKPEHKYKSHVPYAAGYMWVDPNATKEDSNQKIEVKRSLLKDGEVHTCYAYNYRAGSGDNITDWSAKMLKDMIGVFHRQANKLGKSFVVYFHNLGHFDGLLLLNHLALCQGDDYHIRCLIRNRLVYEISVYTKTIKKRILFKIHDSNLLLKGKLKDLGKCLCPDLCEKGDLDHGSVTIDSLKVKEKMDEYISYLEKDVIILGGVMKKAQEIYWNLYSLDIVDSMTNSSVGLKIFRTKYYDEKKTPIYKPNINVDKFVRAGYYGGHSDVYIPMGFGLYQYDINSLYPYVMQKYDMPGGKPVWHNNLLKMNLKDMFGFVKALVICPKHINKPFLPYKEKDKTLLFPTGRFVGIYFTEELAYAEQLGYKVYPICGYLFDRMESPFKNLVHDLYKRRLEAKKRGDDALAYIEKMTMNSLYGRFGITPETTLTAIMTKEEFDEKYMGKDGFMQADPLNEDILVVSYKTNMGRERKDLRGSSPNSAIQISAAITGYARIHMQPFISRDDCHYTDTDSIVISEPLPEEYVSATELGKFKLEHKMDRGLFLAPKLYKVNPGDGKASITKHKGAGKAFTDSDWYERQLKDTSLKTVKDYINPFHRNWNELLVQYKNSRITMGISSKKRIPVYRVLDTPDPVQDDLMNLTDVKRGEKVWIGTIPIHLGDEGLAGINPTGHKALTHILNENEELKKLLKESENGAFSNEKPSSDDKQSDDPVSKEDDSKEDDSLE